VVAADFTVAALSMAAALSITTPLARFPQWFRGRIQQRRRRIQKQ
jgi:hypothetical protein